MEKRRYHDDVVKDLRALRLAQSSLEVVRDFAYLGATFGFHKGNPHNFRLSSFGNIKAEIGRAACLPLTTEPSSPRTFLRSIGLLASCA